MLSAAATFAERKATLDTKVQEACKQFHSARTCLLRQLADGTAGLDTAKCKECEATREEINLNFAALTNGADDKRPVAQERGYHRAGQLGEQLWDAIAPSDSSVKKTTDAGGLTTRCPHCGAPAELSGASSLSDLTCPTCGEPFCLIEENDTSSFAAGRKIGHFKLVAQVGAGSFGVVWRALDTELERTVAVKIPRRQGLSNRDIEKFVHEARASATLNHPNIVSVHEIGREGDTVFIVADLVEGMTLADYLTGPPMSPRDAARLCATVAGALHHAHEQGVVHRDLKPGNIGVDRQLNPYIMDFGLALRGSTEMTMTTDGKILGTPGYMSPEQARGDSHAADRRSDIYSLGVILFEALTGERPFRGNVRVLLQQIIHDEPPSPQRLNSAVPRDLATICLKCLEKSPERRYQSADTLREEFERFLGGRPIAARPVSAIERGWRWCKRNPLPAALTALLFMSLAMGTTVSTWKWLESDANARVAERRATEMQQQSGELLFQRGRTLCESGNLADGLNWMAASLRTLPEDDSSAAWRAAVRTNLLSWYERAPRLLHRLELPHAVNTVACSPTEDLLITGDMGGTARRFDLGTGEFLGMTESIERFVDVYAVQSIAFDPAGKHFLVARAASTEEDLETTLTRVDASTGERTKVFSARGILTDVAYNAEGKQVAVVGADARLAKGFVWLLDATSWDAQRANIDAAPWCVEYTPDGAAVVVGSGEQLLRVDAATMAIADLSTGGQTIASTNRHALAWNPQGDYLLAAMADGTAAFWQFPQWNVTRANVPLVGNAAAVASNPTGEGWGVADWSGQTQFFDAVSGRVTSTKLEGPSAFVWDRFGEHIVAYQKRRVDIWDTSRLSMRAVVDHGITEDAQAMDWRASVSPGGSRACVGDRTGFARILDPATGLPVGRPLQHPLTNVTVTAFSPDGSLLATSCCSVDQITCYVRLWWAENGEPATDWIPQSNWVKTLTFSPDGKSLATGDYASNLTIWDIQSLREGGSKRRFAKCGEIILSLAFSPDGSKIIFGTADSWTGKPLAHLWDAASMSPLGEPMEHGGWVSQVAFSPDGEQLLTAAADGFVRIWDSETAEMIGEPVQYSASLGAATYSDDGEHLLTGGSGGEVKLWHMQVDQITETATLSWPGDHVTALAFSDDARLCLVGLRSGLCQLCNVAPFMRLGPPQIMRSKVLQLQFRPDGLAFTAVSSTAAREWPLAAQASSESGHDELIALLERDTGKRFDMTTQSAVAIPLTEWQKRSAALAERPDVVQSDLGERLADAIEDGNSYSTRHYADRLLGALQDDPNWPTWKLLACRGAAEASEGDYQLAKSSFQEALRSLPRGADVQLISDSHRQEAAKAIIGERWPLANRYLDLLLASHEEDWTLYRDRAFVLQKREEFELREKDIAAALALDADPSFLVLVGEERATAGRWAEALELYERAHRDGFLTSDSMGQHAKATLVADPERIAALVSKMLDHAETATLTLGLAREIIFHAGVGRIDPSDQQRILELSDKVLALSPEESEPALYGASLHEHAWLLMRVGKLDEAIDAFVRSTALMKHEGQKHKLGLALAHALKGDLESASSHANDIKSAAYRSQQNFWEQQVWDCLTAELADLGVELPTP